MSRAVPWNIKGVDFDAREAAREAARRSGMSLGEWMNSVIADRASEVGVSADDFDADEKLEAVANRLSRMRGSNADDADDAPRAKRRIDRQRGPAANNDRYSNPALRRRPEPEPRPSRSSEVRWREPAADAETLLESAIEAFERRASRDSEKTARAIADVADLIESSHSRNARGQ